MASSLQPFLQSTKCSIKFPRDAYLRPTLDEGPGSNFLGTNFDWFEANWILELDYTLVPRLIVWWAVHLALFFGVNQLIFPSKEVSCRFSLNLPFVGLGLSSKDLGTNLKLSTKKITWIHWSMDLGHSSQVALRVDNFTVTFLQMWGDQMKIMDYVTGQI
jgi:hypothetical protein